MNYRTPGDRWDTITGFWCSLAGATKFWETLNPGCVTCLPHLTVSPFSLTVTDPYDPKVVGETISVNGVRLWDWYRNNEWDQVPTYFCLWAKEHNPNKGTTRHHQPHIYRLQAVNLPGLLPRLTAETNSNYYLRNSGHQMRLLDLLEKQTKRAAHLAEVVGNLDATPFGWQGYDTFFSGVRTGFQP